MDNIQLDNTQLDSTQEVVKLAEKTEYGLSRDEWKWFEKYFLMMNHNLLNQSELLHEINGKLLFFVVLAVIGIIFGLMSVFISFIR